MSDLALEKYENVILYLCKELGGTISGRVKLLKLLYYVDFDRYEYKESCKSITGDDYVAWPMGPAPVRHVEILNMLEDKGLLEKTKKDNKCERPTEVYKALAEPNMTVFDDEEKFILKRVAHVYGGLTGTQLKNLTHKEAPYIATEQDKNIMYGLAFYRETDFNNEMAA